MTAETRGGKACRGTLRSFDFHFNVVLEPAVEVSSDGKETPRSMVTLRGDGLLFVQVT